MSFQIRAAAVVAAALLTPLARSQQLVRDLVQSVDLVSSQPRSFLALPTCAVFLARTEDAGEEPWVTDGTPGGTFRVMDLVPGRASSAPVVLCEYQGKALCSVTLPGAGARLLLTDGTMAGTTWVPPLGVTPTSFVRLANGRLLAMVGTQVYATDLTAAGTQLIPGMRRFLEGTAVGGVSHGTCESGTGTFDLWATDGTVAGSRLVAALPAIGRPAAFVPWNGRIYFQEGTFAGTSWISSTDGVAGFTRHAVLPPVLSLLSESMFVRGNVLVFRRGALLGTSDLTQAGTAFLNVPCLDVGALVEYAGRLWFRASTPANGYELWTTDGTASGTSMVADLSPGSSGSHPEHLLATPAGLVFRALLPQGRRLLRLVSPASIQDLGSIPLDAPNNASVVGPTSGFVPVPNGLVFAGTDAAGSELWHHDGNAPPSRLMDINATGASLLHAGSGPRVAVRDRLSFVAYDPAIGAELWSTDGTAAGTHVLDLVPGPSSEFAVSNGSLVRFGDRLAFASQMRAGITDRTLAGTVWLTSPPGPGNYFPCKVAGEHVYFLRNAVLHRSDGTAAGTAPLPFSSTFTITDYEVLSSRIVLRSGTTAYGTDGVANPEWLGINGYEPKLHRLAGDKLVLSASDGIYVTDGTRAGTVRLAMLQGTLGRTATAPDRAFVLASASPSGAALWQTDGTAAGTFVAAMLPAGLFVDSLVATETMLFAVATDAASGRELWRLDASTSQMVLVADLAPGVVSGVQSAAALGSGDLLFVAAGDPATGVEPFISDGTAAGTVLVHDVHPGAGSSNPTLLGIADQQVFFMADDGVHGTELWAMPLAVAQAASVQNIGFGCRGSLGLPRLQATGAPHPGAAGFALRLDQTPGLGLVALALANDHGVSSLLGCEFVLGGSVATRLGFANLAGQTSFALPLPAVPQLVGVRFVAQGLALDPLAPAGFSTSDGVIFVAGR